MWHWVKFQGVLPFFFNSFSHRGIGEVSRLFGILSGRVGREPALPGLRPPPAGPHAPCLRLSLSAGGAPHARHFSANISTTFSSGENLFAESRPFPGDEQIFAGNYQSTSNLFYCYFGYQCNNDKAQRKELILIQGKRFSKAEIPEGILFYGVEKRLQF